MENRELPLLVKTETIVLAYIWCGLTALYTVLLCLGQESGWTLLPIFIMCLLDAVACLPKALLRRIRFTAEGLEVHRRFLKPIMVRFSSFRQGDKDYLEFAGYTLDLSLFQNREELSAALAQCREEGRIQWVERVVPKHKKVGAIVLAVGGVLLLGSLVYYMFIAEDMRQLGAIYAALAGGYLVLVAARALYRRHLRARVGR